MRLIVDANVLFSLAKPSSVSSSILLKHPIRLYSPYFALEELSRYQSEITQKAGISSFDSIISSLRSKVDFIDEFSYKDKIAKLAQSISDPGDVAYLALAVTLGLPIWSNDKHLKEQSLVDALTTAELIELLDKP